MNEWRGYNEGQTLQEHQDQRCLGSHTLRRSQTAPVVYLSCGVCVCVRERVLLPDSHSLILWPVLPLLLQYWWECSFPGWNCCSATHRCCRWRDARTALLKQVQYLRADLEASAHTRTPGGESPQKAETEGWPGKWQNPQWGPSTAGLEHQIGTHFY